MSKPAIGLTFGSVCSGIEAASVAWNPIGIHATWLAEVDKFPSAVLAHHYPDTVNLGDMTKLPKMVSEGAIYAPDVLVGGTPCQAFSIAGMRGGLSDERGVLTIKYVELADAIDDIRSNRGEPESIIVWENVLGVLSSKDNAFGCFLGALAGEDCELQPTGKRWTNAGCVYGPKRAIAWRVLDAQYFGLAQRRKRVFLVASARDGFDPAKVLFEFDSVRRDSAPRREKGESAAGFAASGAGATGFRKLTFGSYTQDETASTMMARDYKSYTDLVTHGVTDGMVSSKPAIAWDEELNASQELAGTLLRGGQGGRHDGVMTKTAVRRLTPKEAERLQGFPDYWTMIPWNGKPASECPDGHRYKALGNSMAVPVMRWIGERILSNL